MSYISRACSSLVRQPYYASNCFILKISGLETILATKKGRWDGRSFHMDEYTLIFLFSQCMRCAQKRDCWESVRFASERSRVRIPLGPPICRIVLYDAAFLCLCPSRIKPFQMIMGFSSRPSWRMQGCRFCTAQKTIKAIPKNPKRISRYGFLL